MKNHPAAMSRHPTAYEPSPWSDEHPAINHAFHAECSNDKKHPLEWAIAFMLLGTLVATGFAACYTRKQWITAEDTEKRSLRAYLGVDNENFVLNCTYCTDLSRRPDYTKDLTDDDSLIVPVTNYGHTPAFDAVGYFNWKDSPYGTEIGSNFSYNDGAQVICSRCFFHY
jgi:hypothetical protein